MVSNWECQSELSGVLIHLWEVALLLLAGFLGACSQILSMVYMLGYGPSRCRVHGRGANGERGPLAASPTSIT